MPSSFGALLLPEGFDDVGHGTSLGDLDSGEQFGELIVVTDGELDASWGNLLSGLGSGLTGEVKDFHCQVFEGGGCETTGTTSDSVCISSLS